MSRIFTVITLTLFLALLLPSCENQAGRNRSGPRASSSTYQTKSDKTKSNQQRTNISKQPQSTPTKPQQQLPLNQLYNKYKSSVFLIYTSDGSKGYQGTGFFISRDGLAISNYHVFEGTSQGLEVIQTIDNRQFKIAEVLDTSKEYDYIIFRVNTGDYHIENPIPIASQRPQIGDDVFFFCYPKGLANTLSKGIVSSFRDDYNRIQTTAEITHGSSGGPLMNMNGEVIGITTSGYAEANLNFAINIQLLNLNKYK